MIPYFFIHNVDHALFVSIGLTLVALLVFGFIKNWYIVGTVKAGLWGAAQTMAIGVLAAGSSYGIVYGINMKEKVETHAQSMAQAITKI
jgi:VIT1/CCC1 family predicted Fe2+/Mn2+ transporter